MSDTDSQLQRASRASKEELGAWYTPKTLQDRDSQHVGLPNFTEWFIKASAVGVAIGGVAWLGAKAFKPQVKMPQWMKKAGAPLGVWQDDVMAPSTYFGLGTKAGILAKTFSLWRKGEEQHMGVQEMQQNLAVLQNAMPSDGELMKDNELVVKMIDYERRQQDVLENTMKEPKTSVAAHQHLGAVSSPQVHVQI